VRATTLLEVRFQRGSEGLCVEGGAKIGRDLINRHTCNKCINYAGGRERLQHRDTSLMVMTTLFGFAHKSLQKATTRLVSPGEIAAQSPPGPGVAPLPAGPPAMWEPASRRFEQLGSGVAARACRICGTYSPA
jgi:hypothetical protein